MKLKLGQFEPPQKFFLFLQMKFIHFFLISIGQKYQNESAPIFCGINLLCAAKEYDQIYWVMYNGQSFKFKGLCVVVHPINWVMYSNPALKIIGLFVVVHPINWDTSHTIQYIRIHHRQSNILGYIRGNPLFADNPIHWDALENDPILCAWNNGNRDPKKVLIPMTTPGRLIHYLRPRPDI